MYLYSVLVPAATRGLGLEFVKQLIALPKPPRYIFATYRTKETMDELPEIRESSKNSEVVLAQMDASYLEEIAATRKIVEETVGVNGLTLLVNNAVTCKVDAYPYITEQDLVNHFNLNTFASAAVYQEMLPLLKKSASFNSSPSGMWASRAAVLNIASWYGFMNYARMDLEPSDKICKAIVYLAAAMGGIAGHAKEHGILVVNMNPGMINIVEPEMSDLPPKESVSNILDALPKLDESHHGIFMDRFGKPL